MVFFWNAQATQERGQFVQVGRVHGRLGSADAHAEAALLQDADTLHRLGPRACASVGIVVLGPAAIQADLEDEVVVHDGGQPVQALAAQNHGIGQHGGFDPRRRVGQHRVDVVEDKRLAAGEEDVVKA